MFNQSMKFGKGKQLTTAIVTACCSALLSGQLGLAEGVSFQQAVNDYTAGKYSQALSQLKVYESSYPDNALVHYYVALCHQSLGHIEQAKKEFQWVADRGDARLRVMAQTGLQQLSRAHTQIAYAPTTSSTPARSSTAPIAKIKKVIEFYADW